MAESYRWESQEFMRSRYVIISPVRDEEKHIEATIQAVAAQTICPERWIIVNDGSSDRTGEIIDSYAAGIPWIRLVNRTDRGFRRNGAGVVEAFGEGYRQLDGVEWDFIVKLDGDLTFESDYMERCLEEFDKDPELGIGGGALYEVIDGQLRNEAHPQFHVRGATKIYRRSCWDDIGGLWSGPGWDTIDEVKANMVGWKTRTFPKIHALHHRITGSADGGWRNSYKNGLGCYSAGYHPLYVLARCVKRLHYKPFVLGSVATFLGFMTAHRKEMQRVDDPKLLAYIRRQQLNLLLGRPSIWK